MQIKHLKRDWTAGAPFFAACLWMLTTLSVATEAAGSDGESPSARGNWTATTEDTTRTDASRDHEVPVRICAPERKHGNGPFPLVVFSHGGGESRETFTYLGTHWAKHGYITVFLTHPGSDRKAIEEQGLRGMGGTLAERFDRLDRNKDGKITPNELPRREIFQRLDRNGDGVIEKAELPGGAKPPSSSGENGMGKIEQHLDLAYGDHERHQLDLYQPADAKNAPIMVHVHGGSWKRGDKRAVGEKVRLLHAGGAGSLSVSITAFCPKASIPPT